jgi:hypothetical protein
VIRTKICFVALAVIQDRETNIVSAFNIMEGVTPGMMPFIMQTLSFFVLWEREPSDPGRRPGTFTITSDGQSLTTQEIMLDFERNMRLRTIINIGGLVVPKPGALRFRIDVTKEVQAEYIIDVAGPQASLH